MEEIQEYINQMKGIYSKILDLIESQNDDSDSYHLFYNFLEDQHILENRDEIKILLSMLLNIANNHHRDALFSNKIEQILQILSKDIKKNFSNFEIFDFFHSNKQIILILFNINAIIVDEPVINFLYKPENSKILLFLYNKVKLFTNEEQRAKIENEIKQTDLTIFENFDEKCKIGENDSYICQLIRNDAVEDFIAYVNRNNISLLAKINFSIFETNSFLQDKNPSLIEYAAFFGSIQIFKYLQLNNVPLTSSLWLYAIHGKNADLIHLLEENDIEPEDKSYKKCLEEAIKCHHNDIAIYILNNSLNDEKSTNDINNKFFENEIAYGFHYFNFLFIQNDLNNEFIIYYLCQYDYFTLVKLLFNSNQECFKNKLISNQF